MTGCLLRVESIFALVFFYALMMVKYKYSRHFTNYLEEYSTSFSGLRRPLYKSARMEVNRIGG